MGFARPPTVLPSPRRSFMTKRRLTALWGAAIALALSPSARAQAPPAPARAALVLEVNGVTTPA